jgi:chemotaxis protein MotB
MFAVGSVKPKPQLVRIIGQIGGLLSKQPGEIELRGHTDARSYKTKVYDNWRLSADRANMAYYMLLRGGIPEKRVVRIAGYADRQLKAPKEPLAAVNRRIEILLRKDER